MSLKLFANRREVGVGREKQLRLHLCLLSLHALYPGIEAPAIRSADALGALQIAHR
jgi:hypothetical protein